MGFIPADAILNEIPGEHLFLQAASTTMPGTCRVELWLNKSAFNPLLEPVCRRYGAALVSVVGRPSKEAIANLFARSRGHTTIILCLSDLSQNDYTFCEDLRRMIDECKSPVDGNIQVKSIGLTPEQVLELEIPMVPAKRGLQEVQKKYKSYLKPYGLSEKRMAELDCLEVYYPGGIAGFVEKAISKTLSTSLPA